MLCGAVVMSLGFAVASRVETLLQLYLVLATLLGVGAAMLGWLAGSTLVTNWFERRRGLALGISTVGTTLGGAVMAQVSGLLIESVGWRGAYLIYAVLIAAFAAPAILWIVVDRPATIGLHPDGIPPSTRPGEATTPVAEAAGRYDVLRSADFWRIASAMGLSFGASSAVLVHLVPLAQDRGLPLTEAAGLLSLATVMGVGGKLFFGWLSDRIDGRITLSSSAVLQALGLGLVRVSGEELMPALGVGAATFGFGMGGMLPLHASLVGRVFGPVRFGRVMGMMSPSMLPFQILAIPLAGWLRDSTGHYEDALEIFMCAYLLVVAIGWGLSGAKSLRIGAEPTTTSTSDNEVRKTDVRLGDRRAGGTARGLDRPSVR